MTQVEKYKHSLKITAGIRHSYKLFIERCPQYDVDKATYTNICYAINKKISEKIVKESMELKLPFRLGKLSIRKGKVNILIENGKLKKNKLIVDWGKTWEMWEQDYPDKTRKEIMGTPNKQVVYNMNEHTNGFVFTWKWEKGFSRISNYSVYKFKPTKKNRHDLRDWINNPDRENDYYLQRRMYYGKRKRNIDQQAQEG